MMAFLKPLTTSPGVTFFKLCARLRGLHFYGGCALLLCSWSAASETCDKGGLSPFVGTELSQWQENSNSGKRLVTETGRLQTMGLAITARCKIADWTLSWSDSRGARDYAGATNTGVAATTRSEIDHQKFLGSVLFHANESISVGARLVHNSINRNLLSNEFASGYFEHFQWNDLSLGMQYTQALTPDLAWRAHYWHGRILPGQSTVAFPNYSPASLSLGSGQTRELGLNLRKQLGAAEKGWAWSAAAHLRQDSISEGTPQALYKGSRVIGSAVQPEIQLRSTWLIAKLDYVF